LAEQTFGADHLFCKEPLAYRAIAASTSFVAQISISDLRLRLQRIPNLENHLQRFALERQALIFFKSRTELRSLTSLALRQLLPYLVETKISAGSSLVEAAQTLGYEVLPTRASLNKLDSYCNPWIAYWQGIHYWQDFD
jgi:hypothetical protein